MILRLNKLKKLSEAKFPILSVYLGTAETKTPYPSYFSSQLHSLVHQNLSAEEQRHWSKDIQKIDDYLSGSFDRNNVRSLIFFSSGRNLWEVLDFEFFLPPLCIILHRPYLKPIEEAVQTYQKYLVMLVDREKARLFTVHLGKIEEHQDVFQGQVPQRVKAKTVNLGRTDKIMRHIDSHLNEHLKIIGKATGEFAKDKGVHFVIIGSHHELLPKIKKHLPYPLNKMVLGEFVTELNIPLAKILVHSEQIMAGMHRGEV